MKKDEEGAIAEKDSLGRINKRLSATDREVENRRNYDRSDNISYIDGDESEYINYKYGETSLISDKARVYKGGGWKDRAYWVNSRSKKIFR